MIPGPDDGDMSRESREREATSLLREKLLYLERQDAQSLQAFVEGPQLEHVRDVSGTGFLITTTAFWDTSPGDSDLYVEVTVSRDTKRGRRERSGIVIDPYTGDVMRYANFPAS
jgi:hypothetical protein